MGNLELKRNRENFELNLFERKGSKSYYQNIITPNPKQLAQILTDLRMFGFKVDEAIKIYLSRMKNRDWLGF